MYKIYLSHMEIIKLFNCYVFRVLLIHVKNLRVERILKK